MKTAIFLTVGLGLWSMFRTTSTPTHTLSIRISGLQTTRGTLIISLYASPSGFPADNSQALQVRRISAAHQAEESPVIHFTVPQGRYAVAVLHDENKNGVMDKNWLGIPKEGYCVSNNVKGKLRAPRFEEAQFVLDHTMLQTLWMIY